LERWSAKNVFDLRSQIIEKLLNVGPDNCKAGLRRTRVKKASFSWDDHEMKVCFIKMGGEASHKAGETEGQK
jgi:hypothetical protein